jgi:hypothetical protein
LVVVVVVVDVVVVFGFGPPVSVKGRDPRVML